MKVEAMVCLSCGKSYSPSLSRYVCDDCGIDGILDIVYDYSTSRGFSINELRSSKDHSLWRYKKLLPVDDALVFSPLAVGMTPLYRSSNLERKIGCSALYIKDDGRNPTASLKDRASAVGIVKAIEAGAKAVCVASTGNAASSLSGFAASVGMSAIIFVPKRAPKAKIAQLLVYGARTIIVDDTYDRAFELSIEVSNRMGYYSRNCAYNPYLVEGKKTVAYEIWEQAGFEVPDRVYVSIGDGCIASGVYKGFYDLKQLGLIDRLPRIIGVQAAGCNPVEVALKTGKFEAQSPDTIADSIAVGIPRNRLKALRGLRETAGDVVSVTDDEILDALRMLPRITGVFGEPAAVAAYAGLMKDAARKAIKPHEKVTVIITGNGLKDIDSAIRSVELPSPVAPDADAIIKSLKA